jgi:surface antigen
MTMTRFRLAFLALLVGLAPGLASAQINPFKGRGADRLNSDDVRMLMDASNRLLAEPSPSAGASESWKNTRSGASGTVRLESSTQIRDLPCRVLLYHGKSGAGASPRDATLTWCRVADGRWLIAP